MTLVAFHRNRINRNVLRNTRKNRARLLLQGLEQRDVPATFTVTNTSDGPVLNPGDLPGSLRQAIFDANANPGVDLIDFDSTFSTPQVIALSGGSLNITDSLNLTGPGTANLTIDGAANFRHFKIDGTGTITVTMSGMTLFNGKTSTTATADRGGSILVQDEIVNISNVVFQNNLAGARGGAISLQAAPGVLNISNCSFLQNSTINSGISGGAINLPAGTLNLSNSILSGNSSTLRGGAIYQTAGTSNITGCTFDNSSGPNAANGGGGGQICALNGIVNITNSTLANGTATGRGGAAYFFNGNPIVTISGCTIRDNTTTTSSGGGLNILAGTMVVQDSTIKGNTAPSATARGGGIYVSSVLANIERCTIQNNSAGNFGGGICFVTNGNNSISTVRNSTITGNTAATGGGISMYLQYGFLRVQNCTVVGNTATTSGGGIARHGGALIGTAFLESTIVSGNTNAAAPDVAGIFAANFNLVQNPLGATLNGTGNITGVDPMLGSLQNNGGTTESFMPAVGSPVIDAGANTPAGVPTDQRGPGNTRSFGKTDIGSIEVRTAGVPTAAITLANVNFVGDATYVFTVTYSGAVAINTGTLGDTDIRVTGPNAYDQPAKFLGFTTSGSDIIAKYSVPAPGGVFDGADFGTYTVTLQSGEVNDGTPTAVPGGILGQFAVDVSRNLVVTTDADSGPGSLRQAVLDAAASLTPDTISFDPVFFGTAKTITVLTTINLNTAVTIKGPGTGLLTITGNDLVRIFQANAPARPTITVSDMTLFKGRLTGNLTTDRGAAVFVSGNDFVNLNNIVFDSNRTSAGRGGAIGVNGAAVVSVNNSTFKGNNGQLSGGAVHVAAGTVTFNGSVFSNNTVSAGAGGAISAISGGVITINDSTLSGNTSSASGGAIYVSAAGLTVDRSTISGNQGTFGGGIALANGAAANAITVRNSTISGNTATAANGGGGMSLTTFGMTLNIQNSTLAFNQATNATGKGGGISVVSLAATPGTLTINSTIIAKNTATTGPDVNGSVNKMQNSLVGNSSGLTILDGTPNFLDVDPLLSPLANNGGPTQTHAIDGTSQAVGNGNNAGNQSVDQRGIPRTVGGTADIGAFEFTPATPTTFIVTNLDDSGAGSLRQAILDANSNAFAHDSITFDSGLSGTILLTSGEMLITDNVTIVGLAGGKITVSGNNAGRIFNIDDNTTFAMTVNISDLIITAGSSSGDGGAIFVQNEKVTLDRVTVSNSTTTTQGGGIGVGTSGSLVIRNSTISGNSAPTVGVVGTGGYGGGIYFANNGGLTIENSTISGNSAAQQGGGLYFFGTATGGTLNVRNSTFSGNTAGTDGGGIVVRSFTGDLLIQNSTVAFNTATSGSGGGVIQIGTTGTITLESSIVAKNTNTTAPDVGGTVTANFSLIGNSTGATMAGGGSRVNIDPLLGALADNGGPTMTHRLLPGSPAINTGRNLAGLTTDQRGLTRESPSGKSDMGAYEVHLPTITQVVINGGDVQRSRVTSVTIVFSEHVTLPGTPETAFELKRQGDGALPTLTANVDNSGSGTKVTLTFSGTTAVDFGSLADGRYTLKVFSTSVTGFEGSLDGNNDGTSGDDYVLASDPGPGTATNIFRLFGDGNGDGVVTSTDFAMFRSFFGLGASIFDFNNNAQTNSDDFAEFRKRFGLVVP